MHYCFELPQHFPFKKCNDVIFSQEDASKGGFLDAKENAL